MRAHTLFHLNILYVKLSDRMDAMVMHLLIDTWDTPTYLLCCLDGLANYYLITVEEVTWLADTLPWPWCLNVIGLTVDAQ